MNIRRFTNYLLAAMAIAASTSACMQEALPSDEALTELESVPLPGQEAELAAIQDEASARATEPGEPRPDACPGPDPCPPVDVATATPCNYTTECPTDHYCHPYTHVCNFADGEQCETSAQCVNFGAEFYCHDRRCHPLGAVCTSNTCPSGQYCHVGICHADACSTNADCPAGLNCSTSRRVCRIP